MGWGLHVSDQNYIYGDLRVIGGSCEWGGVIIGHIVIFKQQRWGDLVVD